jgi:hypothetical protein
MARALKLQRFTVWLAPAGSSIAESVEADTCEPLDCVILHPDQTYAERTGPRYGIHDMNAQSLAFVGLWCWSALKRSRPDLELGEWPEFNSRIVYIEKAGEPDGGELEEEDSESFPTLSGAVTGSHSYSLENSAAGQDSGGTPAGEPITN